MNISCVADKLFLLCVYCEIMCIRGLSKREICEPIWRRKYEEEEEIQHTPIDLNVKWNEKLNAHYIVNKQKKTNLITYSLTF